MKREILLLGDQRLYEPCAEVSPDELPALAPVIQDLHDTLLDFRERYHAGRAIAAPQIAVPKRLIYMFTEHPTVFINPVLSFPDNETMTVLDDCMSFPGLLVKVSRRLRCRILYRDTNWQECSMDLEGNLSELLQHEYDHLDGILATMRALDKKSFVMRKTT